MLGNQIDCMSFIFGGAHMEQHLHTIRFLSCQRSINRSQIPHFDYRGEDKMRTQTKNKKKSVSKWELVKTQTVKQNEKKTHFDLDEVIVNRRTQFKLIAIKSGTDSNLLSVTSYAAGLLWSVCSMRLSFSRKLEFVKTMIGWACPRFFFIPRSSCFKFSLCFDDSSSSWCWPLAAGAD